jgi:hypothetical protein
MQGSLGIGLTSVDNTLTLAVHLRVEDEKPSRLSGIEKGCFHGVSP